MTPDRHAVLAGLLAVSTLNGAPAEIRARRLSSSGMACVWTEFRAVAHAIARQLRLAMPSARVVYYVLALVMLGTGSPASAQGAECSWGSLASASGGRNLLYIDGAAAYWSSEIALPEGAQLRLTGQFPHARYMSLITHDARRRPIHHLTDIHIEPDPSSTNPFMVGADRNATQRSFTIRIFNAPKPTDRIDPNTLYARASQSPSGNEPIRMTLRVYLPDHGASFDSVELPQIEILHADGRQERLEHCHLEHNASKPSERAESYLEKILEREFAKRPALSWHVFTPNAVGGNQDNAYIDTGFDPALGDVLAFKGKAPTFPKTLSGEPVMADGQLRYWSFCTHYLSTVLIDCVPDEAVPLDPQGQFMIVMTAPDKRPKNAVPECGVTWLPAPETGLGTLVYRHMLPDPSFREAIQFLGASGDPKTLGEYLPKGRYYSSKADFEALGCPARMQDAE